MIASAQSRRQGEEYLAQTQNSDGGWGYRPENASSTEPTALAVLALPAGPAAEAGLAWLFRTQREEGGWGVNAADDAANGLTAWAVWAMLKANTAESRTSAQRGVTWLLEMPVARSNDPISSGLLKVDPTLAGWAWQPNSGAWIEPTALNLVVLSLAGQTGHPRLAEGLAFLRDRICSGGGWNVGAPFNFGRQMSPTPYHTALGLLALQLNGASPADPVVSGSIAAMRRLLALPLSAASLALGILALLAWQEDADPLLGQLLARQSTAGDWENSPYATAAALLILPSPPDILLRRTEQ